MALPDPSAMFDARVRVAAFAHLEELVRLHGDVLPRQLLSAGFEFEGTRVPFVAPQGIFKPAVLPSVPLTITTAPDGPYNDSFTPDGFLSYRYRGTDPTHRDNVGLREAMKRATPLIYLHGVALGRYLAIWPVFVVGDNPEQLTFTVAADDALLARDAAQRSVARPMEVREAEVRRAYITATVRVRLHQRAFRERVLRAYRDQCSLCRLRHRDLLDAAHIIPDRDPQGEPVVSNGLAMCKIHHAAFDHRLIGIRPDFVIEVRSKILEEEDGPMLRHGLQGLHQSKLVLPTEQRFRPDTDALNQAYKVFRGAA